MKILYYSDNYTWDNYGTKRSMFVELEKRPKIKAIWIDKEEIGNIVERAASLKPDQIWLVHSSLTIPTDIKEKLNQSGIKVVGFGMSDPNYFTPDRFESYNAYITNNYDTFMKYKSVIPCHYNRTACDFKFHKWNKWIIRDIPTSLIGVPNHPWFENKTERIDLVNLLRKEGVRVLAYGAGWPEHPDNYGYIQGRKFLKIIQKTMLGLDVQDFKAPLAHRMFEYSGCATPVITWRREEVYRCFEEDKEILMYDSHDEFVDKVKYYLKNTNASREIGVNAYKRCIKEHSVVNRIDGILSFIYSL